MKKMKAELPAKYKQRQFKFVLVVMDEDVERGIQYTKKYPAWDEISIGKFYYNELMLQHVNKTQIPGVPHIMVYNDVLTRGKFNVPLIQKRSLLVDLLGAKTIDAWVNEGYKLGR